ncbi:acetyl-CoA carboxylase biotin carboxyl carrier protein subunit [Paraburkholderia caledonica]|uniref:Acetyl-CoA carboxylase biotin carboxyl carrier protein n=1 Tax=Paraburkholderia caledonica TaxID=134536 RepID=A0AB73INK2_9BURK|nr:acetyl-CoA carboxylase biotin carboxyl carrier protein [Paraburkholderia caledonica]
MTKAPIPILAETTGSLWKIVAQPGEHHDAGAELFVLESMKMEIPVEAECAGTIHEYHVAEGNVVEEGQPIATFIPD